MLRLFRALAARIKALFIADAALEIQTEMAIRNAERKAAMLRLAARFEAEGLTSVASNLRKQAEALDLRQSPDGIMPGVEFVAEENTPAPTAPALSNGAADSAPRTAPTKSAPRLRQRKR